MTDTMTNPERDPNSVLVRDWHRRDLALRMAGSLTIAIGGIGAMLIPPGRYRVLADVALTIGALMVFLEDALVFLRTPQRVRLHAPVVAQQAT